MLWKPFSGTRHVTSTCNLSSIILKGIESPFFLFRPLTKLPHPNMIDISGLVLAVGIVV